VFLGKWKCGTILHLDRIASLLFTKTVKFNNVKYSDC